MPHDQQRAGRSFSDWATRQTQEIDGEIVECVDMLVKDVDEDGTRTVRVVVMWSNDLRFADVKFSRATWEAHGGD
jgi:hypothetical protein